MDRAADSWFRGAGKWREENALLREVLLGCELEETVKWGKPCYRAEGRNIVILQPMKDFLALLFFKGALLRDEGNVLKKPGPNSRISRRMQFTSAKEVAALSPTIRTREARIDKYYRSILDGRGIHDK